MIWGLVQYFPAQSHRDRSVSTTWGRARCAQALSVRAKSHSSSSHPAPSTAATSEAARFLARSAAVRSPSRRERSGRTISEAAQSFQARLRPGRWVSSTSLLDRSHPAASGCPLARPMERSSFETITRGSRRPRRSRPVPLDLVTSLRVQFRGSLARRATSRAAPSVFSISDPVPSSRDPLAAERSCRATSPAEMSHNSTWHPVR